MPDSKENFKLAYAVALAGQLGFYIAVPILIAILGGKYLDKVILDKYLLPGRHTVHYIIIFVVVFFAGIFSIWQIYKLILPLMEDNDNERKKQ